MERPPKKYVCEKCGYLGDTSEHEGCDYLALETVKRVEGPPIECKIVPLYAMEETDETV